MTQMPPGDSPLADVLKDLQDDLEMALERVRCLRAGSAGGAEPAKGWPKRMEQKPDQAPSYRGYVNGWNECLSDCERALAAPPAAPDGQRTRPPSHGSGPSAARCTDPDCTLPHPGRAAPDGERQRIEHAIRYLEHFVDYQPGQWGTPQREKAESCLRILSEVALRSASPQSQEAE